MKTYKVKVSYDGLNYHGWAKQKDSSIRTIQQEIENILTEITNEKINIYASGRTDKYVHAIDQCFHFKTNYSLDKSILFKQMKSKQPKDIYFKSIKQVDEKFHSRFCIKYKIYMYKINIGDFDLFERNYALQYNKNININELRKVSKLFIGEKDFLSFSTSETSNNIRTIEYIKINKKDNHIFIYIKGNGFLRSMVRMIVGAMLNYIDKKISLEDIQDMFDNPKKGKSEKKVDGGGLYLYKTVY